MYQIASRPPPSFQSPKSQGLNDYRPVALTSVVMKSFERLMLSHLKSITDPLLDPLQFAYRANSCTSSHQSVKLLKFADDTTLIGLISGGDESAYSCTSSHQSVKLLKFADDTTLIGLISGGDESAYRFVRGVVNGLYKNDEDIQKDPELQQMVSFIYNYGFLQKPDCPSSLKTREEAIKYITMIMFTCSAQHAAVNHGQYDIYAWMPNGPTTMRKPPPKDKKVTEKDIMDTLPDITTTLEAMKVARFLSQVPKDFVPLGNYPEEVANESYMRGPLREFQKTLTEIGTKIRERSTQESEREFPSEYLDPAGMENSITI
ncbi:hydroperoxide isomerase ALOXE3-like [Conger conger]|uniref:hydroperoxide isomerase ALOXE3-like n=1 Tax=Conger conger TaxID=82655 RepID=UPI002A59C418|nr:hydroperoxide isomerase ALOXE3-like [Conger conger]